jgi:hypothetical protein
MNGLLKLFAVILLIHRHIDITLEPALPTFRLAKPRGK